VDARDKRGHDDFIDLIMLPASISAIAPASARILPSWADHVREITTGIASTVVPMWRNEISA
jgi:hypothetical protein